MPIFISPDVHLIIIRTRCYFRFSNVVTQSCSSVDLFKIQGFVERNILVLVSFKDSFKDSGTYRTEQL